MRGVPRVASALLVASVAILLAAPVASASHGTPGGQVVHAVQDAATSAHDRVEPLLEPARSAAGDAPDPYATCDDAEQEALSNAPGQADPMQCRELCEGLLRQAQEAAAHYGQMHDADCPEADLGGQGRAVPTEPVEIDPTPAPAPTGATRDVDPRPAVAAGSGPPVTVSSEQAPAGSSRLPLSSWILVAAGLALLLVAWPVVVLHRRLEEEELLDNDVRRAVHDSVHRNPGRTAAEVAREVDVHYMTARYHLRLLDEFGKVSKRRLSGCIRYFPGDPGRGRRAKVVRDMLDSRPRRRIVEALLRSDEMRAGRLAERLECARSTASFHLDRLVESGLIDRRRVGRTIRYSVRDEIKSTVVDEFVSG